ncbi:MAG: YdeI/OmpD-associated family protein [Bacteroidota bacterium]
MSLVKKLRIKENTTVLALEAPVNYEEIVGELPKGAKITYQLKDAHAFIHLFVKNKSDLDEIIPLIMPSLQPGGMLWLSYPKQASGFQTDLTRDKGWESVWKLNLRWVEMISWDNNWSAFGILNLPKAPQSKATKDYIAMQEIWVDMVNKTVKVPDDLEAALQADPVAHKLFYSYSFSHRKEYVLWVVTAKAEATRQRRIAGTISKLLEGKKSPHLK